MFVQNISALNSQITFPIAGFRPPDDGYIDFYFHISGGSVTVDWQVEAQTQRIIATMAAADLPYTFRIPVIKGVLLKFRKQSAAPGTIDIGTATYWRR